MTFKIKFKAGFFKTELYYLSIEAGKIIMLPQGYEAEDFLVIDGEELLSVSIMSRNLISGEMEIVTRSNTYIGIFDSPADLEEMAKIFAQEFGAKFTFQLGNI